MSASAQPIAYTDAEVSYLLHVSKRTVYRLRKSGALPAIHIGRAVRTSADALAQFLERARLNGARRDHQTGQERKVNHDAGQNPQPLAQS